MFDLGLSFVDGFHPVNDVAKCVHPRLQIDQGDVFTVAALKLYYPFVPVCEGALDGDLAGFVVGPFDNGGDTFAFVAGCLNSAEADAAEARWCLSFILRFCLWNRCRRSSSSNRLVHRRCRPPSSRDLLRPNSRLPLSGGRRPITPPSLRVIRCARLFTLRGTHGFFDEFLCPEFEYLGEEGGKVIKGGSFWI